jgi:hypothetical protein
MIDDSELLAGLAFLQRHAHPDYTPSLKMAESTILVIRRGRALDELRKRPIDDLELSVRADTALRRLDLETIGDVERFMDRPDSALLNRSHRDFFGMKTIKEVRAILKAIGLDRSNDTIPCEYSP